MGGRIAAEAITTQYTEPDIDGSGTDGLTLPTIPNLYVKDAALSGFVLEPGVHTILYEYNSGTRRAKLDDGAWVNLSAGNNDLDNGATLPGDALQKVQLYCVATTDIPSNVVTATEKIVVTKRGDTLPRQFYRYAAVRPLLTTIYSKLGLDTVSFDTLEFKSWDGNPKISFLDSPPSGDNVNGYKFATANDGTDLFIAVGHRVYKRTMSTGAYTLVATLTRGDIVSRMFYNSRNNHLWIYYGKSENGTGPGGYIRRLALGTSTLSAELTISNSEPNAIELLDVNHSGSSYEYGCVYVDNANKAIRIVYDGTPLTDNLLFSQATLGYSGSDGPQSGGFAYLRLGCRFTVTALATSGTVYVHHELFFDASVPGWTDNGQTNTGVPFQYRNGAYHASEDRIYGYDEANLKVKSHTRTGTTSTDVLTCTTSDKVKDFIYANSVVYCTRLNNYSVYSIASNTATLLDGLNYRYGAEGVYSRYFTLTWLSSRLYGVDHAGRLFQVADRVALCVPDADFEGKTVHGALNEVLRAFMLVSPVSAAKSAIVYRRWDDVNTVQVTSGNTLSVTVSEASALSAIDLHIEAAELAEVENGVVRFTYNGTNWQEEVLSDARAVRMASALIPTNIVQDVCKHAYEFFKTSRSLYTVELGNVPLFQYEPLDSGSLTFSTTKIQKTASGPIYGCRYDKSGTMSVEVLI
jgi:hypothetical protein